jgi:hypothetical protein
MTRPGPPEHALEEERQRLRRLAELGEDQHLLLLVGDDLAQLAQARELPALLGRPRAVPEPLGGMIADLLEAHEIRQDDPPALDACRAIEVLELLGEVLHRFLVERGLHPAQPAVRPQLRLVRQVGDDPPVRLEASQDVRARQLAERRVAGRALAELLGERAERLGGAEQAGVQEVEE